MVFSDPIIEGLQNDFLTGKHSDMRLIAGDGTVYHVHKVVLCYQSQFFDNAMKEGRFKEGYENAIHLQDKSQTVVYAMLQHFYYGHVEYPSENMSIVEKLLFAIDLWALADEYIIDSLVDDVADMFDVDMRAGIARVPEQIMSAFPRLVQATYEKTRSIEVDMRFSIVCMAKEKVHDFLAQEEFRQLMRDVPDFAVDLTTLLATENKSLTSKVMESSISALLDSSE